MRKALGLKPYHACDPLSCLMSKKEDFFLLLIEGELAGSVSVFEDEIDDLIVAEKFRHRGYGRALLNFAVGVLQRRKVSPILLCVAEWNEGAVSLYKNNGFVISEIKTVTV